MRLGRVERRECPYETGMWGGGSYETAFKVTLRLALLPYCLLPAAYAGSAHAPVPGSPLHPAAPLGAEASPDVILLASPPALASPPGPIPVPLPRITSGTPPPTANSIPEASAPPPPAPAPHPHAPVEELLRLVLAQRQSQPPSSNEAFLAPLMQRMQRMEAELQEVKGREAAEKQHAEAMAGEKAKADEAAAVKLEHTRKVGGGGREGGEGVCGRVLLGWHGGRARWVGGGVGGGRCCWGCRGGGPGVCRGCCWGGREVAAQSIAKQFFSPSPSPSPFHPPGAGAGTERPGAAAAAGATAAGTAASGAGGKGTDS